MPWTPSDARKKYKKLKKKESEVWAKVANASLENGDDEGVAIAKANAAVKRMKKSEALTEVQLIASEAGRMISSANMKTLKSALQAMNSAIETMLPLVTEDEDDTKQEALLPVSGIESESELDSDDVLVEAAKILAKSDSYDSVRYAVQSAIRKKIISDMMTAKVQDGSELSYSDYYDYCYPYICDLYDGYVVYSYSGELYQCEYTIEDDVVTLGDFVTVKVSYVPTTESTTTNESIIEIKGDLIKLEEKAVRDDDTVEICLITPGWGSSGYYSEQMLKKDGPKIFKKGLHMYMNHPTEEEDRHRPERDVRDLAGALQEDAVWKDNGFAGKGVYSSAKVFPNYKDFIDAAASHIGVSIRAGGTAVEGEAEGRHGLLVNSLQEGYSVDYVTMAGRGGQVLALYESNKKRISQLSETKSTAQNKDNTVVDISQEELDRLKSAAEKADTLETRLNDSNSVVLKMREALILSEAKTLISDTLAIIEMPAVVREKVKTTVLRNVPVVDGELAKDKLIERAKEEAATELKYIESVTGSVTGGKVIGMSVPQSKELNAEEVDTELTDAWKLFGLGENAAKIATVGRFN